MLDSWEFVYKAFEYTLKVHNHPIPSQELVNQAMGKPLKDFYKFFFPNQDIEIYAQTHHEYQKDKISLNKLFPDVESVLKKLKQRGFVIGVISNRTKASLLQSISLAQIDEYIDIVVSAQDVERAKPDKEHVLQALSKLKVKPKEAILVGDTDADILAGKNAGVKTVGVTYGFLGDEIKKFEPDFVIDDLEELLSILKLS